MSAECSRCGSDIVYPVGTWPVGECERCVFEDKLEALLVECEDYLLWEPRKRGHAAVHNRLSLFVRDTREWATRRAQ